MPLLQRGNHAVLFTCPCVAVAWYGGCRSRHVGPTQGKRHLDNVGCPGRIVARAKRVWRCPDPDCPRTTFTEEHPPAARVARPRCLACAGNHPAANTNCVMREGIGIGDQRHRNVGLKHRGRSGAKARQRRTESRAYCDTTRPLRDAACTMLRIIGRAPIPALSSRLLRGSAPGYID